MELSGLSGIDVMEILAGMPDPELENGSELKARRFAEDLSIMIVNALNEQRHPFLCNTGNKIPIQLQFTFGFLIDEVARIEQQLLGGSCKRWSIVLRIAQLLVLRIRDRHGLKDVLGELFLLCIRSQLALKRRSGVGVFLAMQTYGIVSDALYLGAPVRAGDLVTRYEFFNPHTAPVDLPLDEERKLQAKYKNDTHIYVRQAVARHGRLEGHKLAEKLQQSVLDFCQSEATPQQSEPAFNRTFSNQKHVKLEILKELILCLDFFQERRRQEGRDSYNQGSESFVSAVLNTFAQLNNVNLVKSKEPYDIDRTLFNSSVEELYGYFNEANDFFQAFPADGWKLEVDDQGSLVPWPAAMLETPFKLRLAAEKPRTSDNIQYAEATVPKYRLENFMPQMSSIATEEYYIEYAKETVQKPRPASFKIDRSTNPLENYDDGCAKTAAKRPRLETVETEKSTDLAEKYRTATPESGFQSSALNTPQSFASSRSSPVEEDDEEDQGRCIHQKNLLLVYKRKDSFLPRQKARLQGMVIKNFERYGSALAPGPCPACGH